MSASSTGSVVRGQWYRNLRAPPGRPPRQVFLGVWPLLSLSMGYASHLAVKAFDSSPSSSRLALYYTQLSLNFFWSLLFFNAKQVGLALIDNGLLAGTSYFMTKLFHAPTKSVFLLPYCAWLTFATYLNGGIWWLKRGRSDLSKGD